MSPRTQQKMDQVLAELKKRQAEGKAPPPGKINSGHLERIGNEIGVPLTGRTWRNAEDVIIDKIRVRLGPELLALLPRYRRTD